ncbi:MAG: tRNA pseudouridine(13) synthase TruD [Wenzhouxiangella sp.]
MTAHAHGGPPVTGRIRTRPDDFIVIENLGHQPDGEGEHLWFDIEKREQNTVFVATALARAAGRHPRDVSFAGLKDRNAVTRQLFSLHLAGEADPDWSSWDIEGVRILSATRSRRKIQRGRLTGNRFELVVRELDGDLDALEQRLQAVRLQGVPNGFGEQRFGGNNLARARALFAGELRKSPSKNKRGFYLSAARSLIFNQVLAERIERGDWNCLIDGELAVLDGSHSFFEADASDAEQIDRCNRMDIHPSGPLVGEGELPIAGQAAALEQRFIDAEPDLVTGLKRFKLKSQRRALRMAVQNLEWHFPDPQTMNIGFSLGQGSYATSVLRELIDYQTGPK